MPPRSSRPVAVTDRLEVRPWTPADAPRLLEILRLPEVTGWLGPTHQQPMTTVAQARRLVATYAERTLVTPLGFWAVVPHGEEPAGTVLLAELAGSGGEVEVGWYLHPAATGRGLATEAAREALRHGFAAGLPRVWARTHPDNRPSQAVCARLGMTAVSGRLEPWADAGSAVYCLTRRHPAAPR